MKPSTTTAGRAWLTNFDAPDRDAAALLIDSLEIHDHVAIMSALSERVRRLVSSDASAAPAVLVPIRSIEDLPNLSDINSHHVAYRTYDPGAGFPALPGSEADIGAMSRALIENNSSLFISPEHDIEALRFLKPRTFCLLVDYSGSGNQAAKFAQTFRANSTIASWISFGYVRLKVVAYAANLEASRRFESQTHVDFESHTIAKSAMSADWTQEERDRITRVCIDYSSDQVSESPLGYHDSFGLYLTNMRVPNNLPQILIRSGGPFPGLFAGREIPASFVNELRSYRPTPSLDRTLRSLGADALAERLKERTRPVQALRALAALQLLDYGFDEDQVWAMLGLGDDAAVELRTTLIALECITIDNKVTKRGRAELQRATNLGRPVSRYVHTRRSPVGYEPTQLR
ncbi:hypothetical protein B0I08_10789 [Glaciihabitans tibetensis]|uniref:PRTase-CE domain-containing protein n=1 Tax=Glaciihabitans tibetensis TaxID=1266600 RepID=A0A2T0VAL2_9MICO|nr:hypothetical protein [Glaciihabitans tibetensis]PRY67194.1 hypothetical protein B0I08_10789 [Glaciihabitans tibetensis]